MASRGGGGAWCRRRRRCRGLVRLIASHTLVYYMGVVETVASAGAVDDPRRDALTGTSGDMATSGHDRRLQAIHRREAFCLSTQIRRRDVRMRSTARGDEIWRDRIKADLAAQLEAGGTLYGYRDDGAYVATTKHGDLIILRPPKSAESRRSV